MRMNCCEYVGNRWTVVEYVFSLSVALNLSDYSTLFQAIDLGFR